MFRPSLFVWKKGASTSSMKSTQMTSDVELDLVAHLHHLVGKQTWSIMHVTTTKVKCFSFQSWFKVMHASLMFLCNPVLFS